MEFYLFQICDAYIRPGEKASLALPMPEQYSCSPMYMPIKVINGKHDGQTLLCFSTINGDELNGLEILNQLYDQTNEAELHGTLILVPVLNVYGLTHYPRATPSGNPLIQSFPGKEKGSFNERIAHVFTDELLKKSNFCIECTTGSLNHEILPQVYCDFENIELKKIAKSFQTPVITEVETHASSLRQTAYDLNIPLLVYQAGEAMRFDPAAINIGQQGIINVMSKLEMLKDSIEHKISPITSKDDAWISSPKSGILHAKVNLGEQVKKGALLGMLSDPFTNENASPINARTNGVIVGINRSPLIQEGSAIFKIAYFIDNEKAEAIIEEWDEVQPTL